MWEFFVRDFFILILEEGGLVIIICGINTVFLVWVIMFMFVVDDVLLKFNSFLFN